MKIKKVEIQAFRVYDNVKNSTFDFMTELNEVADFVSIHAPNGFGKTSFYDAVEWAFTNKITRYDRRKGFNSDLAKSERANSIDDEGKRKHQLILRNKFSNLDEGFVNLYTTLDKVPYSRMLPKVNKGVPDYKFEDQKIDQGREHFHEVMLSQEWIDAFLKEDNAEVRYEKFVSSFGDVDLNRKYKAVIDLINFNKSKIRKCKEELDLISADEVVEYDSDILVLVNNEIVSVNTMGENFPLLSPSFSEKDDYFIMSLIKDRTETLNQEIEGLEGTLLQVDVIKSDRSKEQVGISSYYKSKAKMAHNKLKLTQLNKLKNQLDEHLNTQSKADALKIKVLESENKIKKLQWVIDVYPQYLAIDIELAKHQKEVLVLDSSKVETKSLLEGKLGRQKELESKLDFLNSAVKDLQKENDTLQDTYQLMNNNEKNLVEYKVSIETEENVNKNILQEIENRKKAISELKEAITALDGEFYDTENTYLKSHKLQVDTLVNKEVEFQRTRSDIEKIDIKINNFDSLNEKLQSLLDIGTKVIAEEQASKCPLCQYNHQSYSELSKQVLNNPLLSNEIKGLIEERAILEGKLHLIIKSKDHDNNELKEQLKLILKNEKKLLDKDSTVLKKSNLILQNLKVKLNDSSKSLTLLKRATQSLSLQNYRTLLLAKISALEIKVTEQKTSELELEEVIFKKRESLNLLDVQIKNIKQRIKKLGKDELYQTVNLTFMMHDLAVEEDKHEFLIKLFSDECDYNSKIKSHFFELEKALKVFVEELPSIDEEFYITKTEELEKENFSIAENTASLELFATQTLGVDIHETSEPELKKILNEKEKQCHNDIEKANNLISKISRIEQHKSNVIPFLKSKKNKKLKEILKKDINFLEKSVHFELNQEKVRLAKFIDKQIESFFYQKLINSLYKKIDPHPRYNEISFQCDFSQDKPKLNVFVSSNSDDDSIVPTLYFSTAQLNILSLSIFLAKALNTTDNEGKPIDCIFIDDPIQSMDSINILSTIDLFRSIVTNMGKQIILSTHDENFQNLLKKKMPEKLFKSKFIEFETFGKLKTG